MATLHEQHKVSQSPDFIARVKMSMLLHTVWRITQGDDEHGLVGLGRRILSTPDHYATIFAAVIATQVSAQNGIETSPDTGEDVTDEILLSAVESIFAAFV